MVQISLVNGIGPVTDMTEMLGVAVSSHHPQIGTLSLHAGKKYLCDKDLF